MIVLDTHVLVWWVAGDARLSSTAARAITREQKSTGQIFDSAITPWEIAMLIQKGRMELAMELDDWFAAMKAWVRSA